MKVAARVLLGLVLAASTARAQTAAAPTHLERAMAAVQAGRQAFAEGRMHDALRAFRDAWALSKTPDVAANMAIIEANFGQHRDAAEHFQFALSHLPPSATDEQRNAIATGLDKEKQSVVTLSVHVAPASVALKVDGTDVPLADEIYVSEGSHTVTATAPGYAPESRSIGTVAGSTERLVFELKSLGSAPSAAGPVTTIAAPESIAADRDSQRRNLAPVFVGGGIAVAGAVFGTVFWIDSGKALDRAHAARDTLGPGDSLCGPGTPYGDTCKALHDGYSDYSRDRNLGTASFIVGGVAAAATLTYWFWPRHSPAAPQASAVVAPGHAELRARWAW